jgi:hypothetical protein
LWRRAGLSRRISSGADAAYLLARDRDLVVVLVDRLAVVFLVLRAVFFLAPVFLVPVFFVAAISVAPDA